MAIELRQLIKNTEERFISYKGILEDAYKCKAELWYMEILRDSRNFEQSLLKKLIEEKTFENDGLNPPFCYNYKKI